jgi:hypothetical protein
MPLEKVRELVGNYIFQALWRFLDKFKVQPDTTRFDITGAPISPRSASQLAQRDE